MKLAVKIPGHHKLKPSLCMPEWHIVVVEVQLYSFLLDESERSGSYLSHLTQWKEPAVPMDYESG